MAIRSCSKFHKIPFIGCLVMTQFVDLKAIQGQYLGYKEAIPTKCKMHQCAMVIHSKYSQLSLSRLRLSRITAYLEEKIWSLF